MRVFKDVKLVEQLGSGIQRILKAYDRGIFKFSPIFLKVSFPMKNAGISIVDKIKLNITQEKVIELIKKNKYTTQEDMSEN